MYRPYPTIPVFYPPFGQLGELPPNVTQGACDVASNQGAKDAAGTVDPKDGFQLLINTLRPVGDDLTNALLTCYMQGYNTEKEKQGVFYKTSQGKMGLVVGGVAGLLAGILIGKVLL